MSKAVVLLSGGQDSTTILGKALHDGFEVSAIGFDYGQRHKVELQQAQIIADALKVPYKILNIQSFGELVSSALTGNGKVTDLHTHAHIAHSGVPNSFVPNRNAVLLTLAHAYAQEVGADTIFAGMCQTDYSGYPDCRSVFISQLESALNTGYMTHIRIVTPLMWMTKAETFKMAQENMVLDAVLELSHTCYEGNHTDRHDWGYGCGECPACKLRANGYAEYLKMINIADGRPLGNY